jgi:hypothetical protein
MPSDRPDKHNVQKVVCIDYAKFGKLVMADARERLAGFGICAKIGCECLLPEPTRSSAAVVSKGG